MFLLKLLTFILFFCLFVDNIKFNKLSFKKSLKSSKPYEVFLFKKNSKFGDKIKLEIVLKSTHRAESKDSKNFTKNFVIIQCIDKNH